MSDWVIGSVNLKINESNFKVRITEELFTDVLLFQGLKNMTYSSSSIDSSTSLSRSKSGSTFVEESDTDDSNFKASYDPSTSQIHPQHNSYQPWAPLCGILPCIDETSSFVAPNKNTPNNTHVPKSLCTNPSLLEVHSPLVDPTPLISPLGLDLATRPASKLVDISGEPKIPYPEPLTAFYQHAPPTSSPYALLHLANSSLSPPFPAPDISVDPMVNSVSLPPPEQLPIKEMKKKENQVIGFFTSTHARLL